MDNLKVGDQIYYKPPHRPGRYVDVRKVGRKWVHFSDAASGQVLRVAIGDEYGRVLDGDYTAGSVYASEEAYVEKVSVNRLWNTIRRLLPIHAPAGVTAQDILDAAKLLRIEDAVKNEEAP